MTKSKIVIQTRTEIQEHETMARTVNTTITDKGKQCGICTQTNKGEQGTPGYNQDNEPMVTRHKREPQIPKQGLQIKTSK